MTGRLLATCAIALCALRTQSSAQTINFRIGPGVAYADRQGRTGLLALEAHWRVLIVRADAHAVYVPDGVAEIGYAGVAVGAAPAVTSTGLRPYLLATIARGVDIREADALTAIGLAAGVDAPRAHLFAELRYENSLQRSDPFHYTLPEHQVTAYLGLRIGRSWPPPN